MQVDTNDLQEYTAGFNRDPAEIWDDYLRNTSPLKGRRKSSFCNVVFNRYTWDSDTTDLL
jgi:hypothetical protein